MNGLNPDTFANLSKAFGEFSVSAEKACESLRNLSACIPPFTEDDIRWVRMNPSLSLVQKYKIIRSMRKSMKGEHYGKLGNS